MSSEIGTSESGPIERDPAAPGTPRVMLPLPESARKLSDYGPGVTEQLLTIFERVKPIVHKHSTFGSEVVLTTETRFADDLGFDSLDAVQVIMDCEDEFEINISDDDGDRCKTVGDLVRLIWSGGTVSGSTNDGELK